jgi:hypothetical protein
VPLVRPSSTVTADVEAVLVAPALPEGDVSSAGTPWAPRGAHSKSMKQAMKEPRTVGRSDR